MRKTLPQQLIDQPKTAETVKSENSSEQLIDLVQDMKGAWNEAAGDLLQPRPEAVASLLKKVLH